MRWRLLSTRFHKYADVFILASPIKATANLDAVDVMRGDLQTV
jgi:hypothetical protein